MKAQAHFNSKTIGLQDQSYGLKFENKIEKFSWCKIKRLILLFPSLKRYFVVDEVCLLHG